MVVCRFAVRIKPDYVFEVTELCIMYALNRMNICTNKEIGDVFGVGYTAVTEAVKRAEGYLEKNKRIANKVRNIIDN
jgi:DNA-binding MarR family transcriptional regulator